MDIGGPTEETNIAVFSAYSAYSAYSANGANSVNAMNGVNGPPGRPWRGTGSPPSHGTPGRGDHRIGTARPPGRCTARPDPAGELLRQAGEDRHAGAFVDVRTTVGTPTLGVLPRKEALGRRNRRPSA